jgi:hypothetical protein
MLVISVADPDPHNFRKLDRHQSEKPDSDPHQSPNLGTVEVQNGAMDDHGRSQWRRACSKWSNGGSVDQ